MSSGEVGGLFGLFIVMIRLGVRVVRVMWRRRWAWGLLVGLMMVILCGLLRSVLVVVNFYFMVCGSAVNVAIIVRVRLVVI